MNLILGKATNGTFCPSCNELILHDPDFIPKEIYCPVEDKLIEIPETSKTSAAYRIQNIGSTINFVVE